MPPAEFVKNVAGGDAARDREDWLAAEKAYRKALAKDGAVPAIWVQYGHALKEQKKLDQALDAYRTALRLDGTNADTHLQLGHALKLAGDLSAAAEAYSQALKLDPRSKHALAELQALNCDNEDLQDRSIDAYSPPAFEGEAEFALLLAAIQASGAAQYELLRDPVFTLSDKTALGQGQRAPQKGGETTVPSGPLKCKTRADSSIFNDLDPDYADAEIPLTRHMVHTWHRFEMRREFHLNSERSRLAFVVAYFRSLRFGISPLPERLVRALNAPAQAYGPFTRFLFAVWLADFREQNHYDIQQHDGYINFLTEVADRRSWAKHLPCELVPENLLTAIYEAALGTAPHRFTKAEYSIWKRSDLYRTKYENVNDWSVQKAFNFDLIAHSVENGLPSSLTVFWSNPVSRELPTLSRFAATLAHLSNRFGNNVARSSRLIGQNANVISEWFRDEVVPAFPQLSAFLPNPAVSPEVRLRAPPQARSARLGLKQLGIDYVPGDREEEIDLLVIGPIAAQSGLGTGARRSIAALKRTSCNFRTLHFAYDNPSVMVPEDEHSTYCGENPKTVLWHYNAEYLQDCMRLLDIFTKGRYNIGYFFWETEVMPKAHQLSADMVDEIWVPSEFVAKCYSGAPVPTVNVGTSVQLPSAETFLGRRYFGFDDDEYVFMFSFDGHSVIHRKNPAAVARAFLKAFPEKAERARLVLKSQNLLAARWGGINGRNEELFELCAGDRRIEIIDRTMSITEYYSLKAACDCYVSLHRSEGFGYGPAEAMALGKPVIMTNYSANIEFARPDNCLLVDAKLVHTLDGEYLYWVPEMMWAEPDIDQAAAHMRRVFEDRAFAARLGERARETITRDFGPDAMARRYAKRLDKLGLNGDPRQRILRQSMAAELRS